MTALGNTRVLLVRGGRIAVAAASAAANAYDLITGTGYQTRTPAAGPLAVSLRSERQRAMCEWRAVFEVAVSSKLLRHLVKTWS